MPFYFDWIILISFLLYLAYTMFVIRREKFAYHKRNHQVALNQFLIHIPTWWTDISSNNVGEKSFYNAENGQNWEMVIMGPNDFPDLINQQLSSKKLIENYLKKSNIVMDKKAASLTDISPKIKDQATRNALDLAIRIEGTATYDQERRIYADISFLRGKQSEKSLIIHSTSSILHGGIEGPYIEHLIEGIIVKEKDRVAISHVPEKIS